MNEDSFGSMETMGRGAAPGPVLDDEASVGSAPTMKAGGVPQGSAGHIDQYELVRKLGGGGFGVVWLVRDTVSGVEYALKTLHPLLKTNEEELERVRDNFALVAKLLHPNIAAAHVLHRASDVAYASEETRRELRVMPGDPVMLMSYAPGVTLSKWRKQFPGGIVPLDKALEIGRQVASALDYAHGERIVHRDIKPANVMVETDAETGRLRARVLDFGLAAEIRSSMSRVSQDGGDTSGTRPYMAPEQWTGKRQDGRTDQYALACMIYEMLDGRPPFAGVFETGDAVIMMSAVKGEAPDEIDGLSASVNAALLKALSKTREERFSTCGEFIAALECAPEPEAPSAGEKSETIDSAEIIRRKVALGQRLEYLLSCGIADLDLNGKLNEANRSLRQAEEALSYRMFADAASFLGEVADRVNGVEAELARRGEQRRASEERRRQVRAEEIREKSDKAIRTALEGAPNQKPKSGPLKWLVVVAVVLVSILVVRNNLPETSPKPAPVQRPAPVQSAVPTARQSVTPVAGDTREIEIAPGVKMAFVWVAPGRFRMGSDDEDAADDERPVHEVTLTKGYWLGKYEVTQREWQAVMGGNPSRFKGDRRPVESVSWYDCQAFVKKVNARLAQQGEALRVRLPTEAEWEFAARGGTKSMGCKYSGSDNPGEVAWYGGDWNKGSTHDVGTKKANELGIHDMSGNVWEWCQDWYGAYPSGAVTDPVGPGSGGIRVGRGGGWSDAARGCRSADRYRSRPGDRHDSLGVRLVSGQ